MEWIDELKGLVIVAFNLGFQGLTLFNIWDPTEDQENWLLAVVNLLFAAWVLIAARVKAVNPNPPPGV